METAKRILAAIGIIIAVLALVISLAGVAGVWYARAQIAEPVANILTSAEAKAASAQQELDQLNATLSEARDQVAQVQAQVQELGSDVEQNKPLLTAIQERLQVNLAPLVDRAQSLMATIRETATAVNSIIQIINSLPFLSESVPELGLLDRLSADIDGFQAEVDNLRAVVEQKRTEIINGAVEFVTTPTSKIITILDEKQASLTGYSEQLSVVQEQLAALQVVVDRGLIVAAVVLTLILLWLAFSQIAVLVLCWRVFKRRDVAAPARQPVPA
jgi:chromosome segregation ATPase